MPKKSIDKNQSCNKLSGQLGVSEFLSELLLLRGIDNSVDANNFLYPSLDKLCSPYDFKNMEQAVARIKKAIKDNEKILIYGDYDCDGVGAIAILYLCFKEINKTVNYYIPNRANEGYGINLSAIDKIKQDFNPDLIITVDCGANSIEEVAYIKNYGIDIIVTDHHLCSCVLPNCLILNPCINDDVSPLCGAGMAFMLSRAVFGDTIASKFIDICAISTIADIVPLIKDNRIIAKCGLDAIKNGKCREGIKQLAKMSDVDIKNITSFDIGYKIAPRLNSSGRLDTAYDSLYLLIEDDNTSIRLLSEQLNLQNIERQNLNRDIFTEAMEMLKSYDFGSRRIIILHKNEWQEGVIGIVAAKITEFFNLPTILLTASQNGDYKGSARSIEGVNIADLLERNNKFLKSYGGHAMAAGLSLDICNLTNFVESINNDILASYNEETFKKIDKYDMVLPLKDVKVSHLEEFSLLEPFGHKNSKPVFCDDNFNAQFSQIKTSNHIKAHIPRGDIINFNGIDYLELFNGNTAKKIIYTINKNYFKGRESYQFFIKDFFTKNIEISNENILCRMLKTISNLASNNLPIKTRKSEKPSLFIAYSVESFHAMLKINPNIEVVLCNLKRMNVNDTLVFCPDENFPYYYYNKITILDSVPQKLNDYFASFAPIHYQILKKKTVINLEISELREDFLFINNIIKQNPNFESMESFYNLAANFGYRRTKLQFYLAVSIFLELELLKVTNSVIICNNCKVIIEASTIYQHFTGKTE